MKARIAGIVAGLLAVAAIAAPLPSFADQPEVRVFVETAPPPPKESVPPTPEKVGYVWSSGYWSWNGSDFVWTEGSWVAVTEPTKNWVPPTWTKQGKKWYFTPGHFE